MRNASGSPASKCTSLARRSRAAEIIALRFIRYASEYTPRRQVCSVWRSGTSCHAICDLFMLWTERVKHLAAKRTSWLAGAIDSRVLLTFALLGVVFGLLALAALQYLNKQQRSTLTRRIEELETQKGT